MGRPVVLSNGQIFVGLNKHGLVHDFYYPYIGLDNLTNTRSERHKIGVWVNGRFSWVGGEDWNVSIDFEADALVGDSVLKNESLGVELQLQDFIDPHHNAFCRRVKVVNHTNAPANVRLFMHQVFQISRAGRADTALYEPDGHYILDYKGRCALLIYGETSDKKPFDQYAVGNYNIEGKEGTFRDAEDGELSGNAVEHGGVDSVIRFSLEIPEDAVQEVDYWVVCAPSQHDAERVHDEIKKDGLTSRLNGTRIWWNDWMAPSESIIRLIDENRQDLTKKSMLVIKAHTDRRGGILASGDSSIFNYGRDYYCYCWPRDGAYAIWPLMRLGMHVEARKFFEFCRDTMHEDGYLMHKYQPDRAIGSTWHPLLHGNRRELAIQEDETAIVIIMLGEYLKLADRDFVELMYDTLVRPAAQFMAGFIDDETNLPHPSYDLWEEKFLTTTYTTSVTYAALAEAAKMADTFGYPEDAITWRDAAKRIESAMHMLYNPDRKAFRKGILLQPDGTIKHDDTLDVSSFYGIMLFGPHSFKPEMDKTAVAIQELLVDKSPAGGVPRYEGDSYMSKHPNTLGNPWFICTLWLAQYYQEKGDFDRAKKMMDWVGSKALPSGMLSEQINPDDASQVSVAPLVWSHAEYINTALDLANL